MKKLIITIKSLFLLAFVIGVCTVILFLLDDSSKALADIFFIICFFCIPAWFFNYFSRKLFSFEEYAKKRGVEKEDLPQLFTIFKLFGYK